MIPRADLKWEGPCFFTKKECQGVLTNEKSKNGFTIVFSNIAQPMEGYYYRDSAWVIKGF